MKPCRKQNQPPRRPNAPPDGPAASSPQPAALHRYVHPIRTSRPAPRPSAEEMLSEVLEALLRQSEQLDEVLRKLEGGGPEA